jgi:hypothetical protein
MDNGHTKGPAGAQNGTERSLQTHIPEAKTKAREVSMVTAPTLELPKGGGAIRGIGETFIAKDVSDNDVLDFLTEDLRQR